jgi:hypothetical protein
MALADTSKAIGAVSRALKQRIDGISGISVSIGHPSAAGTTYPQVNLFLYEIVFDPHLKNTPLTDSGKPPLWVVLKYLLTAFQTDQDSDSDKAHEHLGAALRAVYTDDLLRLASLPAADVKALAPNPSALHVTFDEAPSELMAKLMQGPDDRVRLSACFQVRPVMIAPAEPPALALLVGVDYTQPPVTLADPYVGIDVIPSMGARIESVSPPGFEVGEVVTLQGTDLHLENLSVQLGPVVLPVIMQQADRLRFRVDAGAVAASGVSAGSHPVTVVQALPGTGKKRRSNTLIANLVPTLMTAVPGGAVIDAAGPPVQSHRNVDLGGSLLGVDADDTIAAFYRDGRVYRAIDVFNPVGAPPPPPAVQPARQFVLASDAGVPAGDYQLILIVNGQRAPQSPQITVTWP